MDPDFQYLPMHNAQWDSHNYKVGGGDPDIFLWSFSMTRKRVDIFLGTKMS